MSQAPIMSQSNGGTTLIVVVQGFNMLSACCLIFDVIILAAYTSMTFVSAATIILGFSRIVGRQLSESKKSGEGQPPAQDGAQGDADKTDTKNEQGEGQPPAPDGASTDLQFRFRSGRAAYSPTRTEYRAVGLTEGRLPINQPPSIPRNVAMPRGGPAQTA